jgi:V/A-type H+/Na+-transporting ATPase subunit I
MIIPMKKVTLLCLADEREASLREIRYLGALHIVVEKLNESDDRTDTHTLLANVEKSVRCLDARVGNTEETPDHQFLPRQLYDKVSHEMTKLAAIEQEIDSFYRMEETLSPWGDFSPETIKELAAGGIYVYCCEAPHKNYAEYLERKDITVEEVNSDKALTRFIVLSQSELDTKDLALAVLPEEKSLNQVKEQLQKAKAQRDAIDKELDSLACQLSVIEDYCAEVKERLEFLSARDSMADHEEIISIQGFIPETRMDEVNEYAKKHGWALLIEEPDSEDQVPTLITLPKVFRMVQPLFGFLGISPGYREIDVSVGVLFFFTIFFGIIVGDAGYGSLFLLGTLGAATFMKNKSDNVKLALRLSTVLSLATITWGALSGNWFGLAAPGIKFLTEADPTLKNANVMFICFIIAVAQLSMGHIWQAVVHGKVRKAFGQLGWIFLLGGNFFLTVKLLVYPGAFPVYMYYLYGTGMFLIIFCDVNWKDVGEAFNFPFSIINSFVDILSYIRLFAVGLAGYEIARSFNGMGGSLINIPDLSWWMIPLCIIGGALVIVFGQALNIVLCLLSVLVHGVRLNTLEFSNHVGLTWAGIEFKPFKKKES